MTFEKVYLDDFQSTELINGRPFDFDFNDGVYSVYLANGDFVGIGIASDKKVKIKAFILDL